MPLFQPKIVAQALNNTPQTIPEESLNTLQNWKDRIESGSLAQQTEVAIHAPFTQNIMVDVLGYQTFGASENWTLSREYGVASGAVDLALGQFSDDKSTDQVIAPFELKGAKTKNLDAIMPSRHKTPVQQAWEYAKDIKGAQWVLVSNYLEIRLYAIGETSLVYEKFELTKLTDPAEYARFILLLHADNLLSGKSAQLLQNSQQADREITDRLYQDYKSLRTHLITHLINENPDHAAPSLIAPAQKLLDRFLFVAFAEDKRLIPENSIQQAFEHSDPYNPRPLYENFRGLFHAIDQGSRALNIPAYNGGLFATDPLLDQLIVDDSICQQVNELAKYDFDSEVSVTVLGHIFEQSISDLEQLTAEINNRESIAETSTKAVTGKRKQHGVVYTPDHITAFIVEQTLGAQLETHFQQLLTEYGRLKKEGTIQWKKGRKTEFKFWYAWQERLKQIRVVDPACGSGAFLVAAFDQLHAAYQRINDKLAELTGQHSVLDLNKEILNNNLFGVDINPESIEITKLSLWLKTAEVGKPLTSLDTNLRSGNSLALENPISSETSNADFSWQSAFTEIMAQGGFDVVLGNPPYVRQERFSNLKPWLEEHYSVYHGVADLYSYFFELGHRLLKKGGRLGYISSSTFFKTGSGEPLRHYLSHKMQLEKMIDFGDLQIFEGVTTYPAILILQRMKPTADSQIKILSMGSTLPENLNAHFTQYHGVMRQQQLGSASWQLEDERLFQLRQKLTDGHPTLKAVYGSPYRGVLTGLNAAFVIDSKTRNRLIEEDPNSAELLKPFLEGKDLKRWHAQPRGLWLITIPKLWTRQQMQLADGEIVSEEEAWSWLSTQYPAVTEWLHPFAEKGRKRGDKGEFWWELRACAYYEEFTKTKIQYAHFSPTPLFHLNRQGDFSNDKSYIIPTGESFVSGLLNSSSYWFLMTALAPFVRGGYYELRAQYIETLPIPNTSSTQKEIIGNLAASIQQLSEQRYTIEEKFRHRLPDLCPEDRAPKLNKKMRQWWRLNFNELQKVVKSQFKTTIPLAERNDWEAYFELEKEKITELNQQITQQENQLNQEVYDLFELTPEEIQQIDKSLAE
jgi:type I restriction-modification system DNA methylase subunit